MEATSLLIQSDCNYTSIHKISTNSLLVFSAAIPLNRKYALSSTSTILSLISIFLRDPTLMQPLQSHALTPVLFDLHIPLFLLSPYIRYGISPL